jgi:hypothetical protein
VILKALFRLGMMAHSVHPSTTETEAGARLCLKKKKRTNLFSVSDVNFLIFLASASPNNMISFIVFERNGIKF